MNHCIMGYGQIGKLIGALLEEVKSNQLEGVEDKEYSTCNPETRYDYAHICIPYSPKFTNDVNVFIEKYKPRYVIIHSTVKVGTTETISHPFVIYSPVNGRHDNGFLNDVKMYAKYFASKRFVGFAEDNEDVSVRLDIEKMFPISCDFKFGEDVRSLEFAKINCTNYTAYNVIYEKWLYNYCKENKLDYEKVYRHWGTNYNNGVRKDWKRPIYEHMEGGIGGHCLIPNLELVDDDFIKMLKILNERWAK